MASSAAYQDAADDMFDLESQPGSPASTDAAAHSRQAASPQRGSWLHGGGSPSPSKYAVGATSTPPAMANGTAVDAAVVLGGQQGSRQGASNPAGEAQAPACGCRCVIQ